MLREAKGQSANQYTPAVKSDSTLPKFRQHGVAIGKSFTLLWMMYEKRLKRYIPGLFTNQFGHNIVTG